MEPFNPADRRSLWTADSGIRAEVRATLALAAPLAAANLAQMAMGVTNTLMVGRLGAMPLAAVGLGGMFYFTVGVMLQGILFAVAPLAAHALGAGDRAAAGRIAGAGWVLSVMLALPFVATLTSLDRFFRRSATTPRSPPKSAAICGRLRGVRPPFLASGCCVACSPQCHARVR